MTSKARPFRLSWTHYFFLLGVKNPDERSFYEIESADQNWNLRELRRQFDSGLYEQARYTKSDLEGAIISQIERFLLELGEGFLLEARQKRFTFDGEHFFVGDEKGDSRAYCVRSRKHACPPSAPSFVNHLDARVTDCLPPKGRERL